MAEQIETAAKFADTPEGWAQRWNTELESSREALRKWHEQAEEVVKRYRGELDGRASLNLFPANVDQREAQLYGQQPKVEAKRRNADAADDVARVGGEMLNRVLNNDIERDDDSYAESLRLAEKDWLLLDLGNARCRYVAEFEPVAAKPEMRGPCPACRGSKVLLSPVGMAPSAGPCPTCEGAGDVKLADAVPASKRKTFEDVETDYVHWQDQLWSPCRTFSECRWWGFAADMTRDELVKRFPEDGAQVPLTSSQAGKTEGKREDLESDPWARARVWEIWHKETRDVFWVVEGYRRILDRKHDPLGLKRFWPFPKPLIINCTNSAFIPQPTYCRTQDLYNELDELEIRINLLTRAVKVAGVYDKTCGPLKSLLEEGKAENKLIPVDDWAAFAEKGGMQGRISLLPFKEVVEAIGILTQKQAEKIQLLYQVSGQSDIERGQQMNANETATTSAIKARNSSVRGQRLQDVFVSFAEGLQKIRAEIIGKHFDAATIVARSNMAMTPDAAKAMRAAELLKSQMAEYRIKVSADSVSMTDFAALRQERGEAMQSVAGVLQVAPLVAQVFGPQAGKKLVLQLVQWQLAGCRGSSTIEGVIDQAIEEAQKPPPPAQPDPRAQLEMAKGQMELKKGELDIQATQAKTQATVVGAQADIAQTRMDMERSAQEAAMGSHMWGSNAGLLPPMPGQGGAP